MTQGQFISREQLSEAARLGVALPGFEKPAADVETATEVEPSTEVESAGAAEPETQAEPAPEVEPVVTFEVSSKLTTDTASSMIILDRVASIDDLSGAIAETGQWLRTGAIELPQLDTNTGEFAVIQEAAQADQALISDSISGSVSSIEPLSAAGVVGRSAKISILPVKLPRGQNQVYLITSISVLMVAMVGLVLGAYMLGIF